MKKCGGVCFVWWGHHRVATVGAAIEINWLRLFQNGSQCHQPSEYYARSTKLTLRYLLEGHGRRNHRTAYISGSKRKLVEPLLPTDLFPPLPAPYIQNHPNPVPTGHLPLVFFENKPCVAGPHQPAHRKKPRWPR